jgi:diketogulonate reductase-like aldo/keto reductase
MGDVMLCCTRTDTCGACTTQIELHPQLDQSETLAYCARKGIVVEGYGAIGADGLLEQAVVERIASRRGRSPAQVTLRHTLQRAPRTVALAKSLTPSRIDENLRVFDFELDAADMRALDALATRDGRSYWDNSDVP